MRGLGVDREGQKDSATENDARTTALDLDALQALCDKATPGPWEVADDDYIEAPEVLAWWGTRPLYRVLPSDAPFIAAARSAVPALIAELRSVYSERDNLREGVDILGEVTESRDRLALENEALRDKVDALNGCGCGYDNPGDVCMVHQPEIQRLNAEVARLKSVVAEFESVRSSLEQNSPTTEDSLRAKIEALADDLSCEDTELCADVAAELRALLEPKP